MFQSVYIIAADYVNGISIYKSLKALKIEGDIVVLNTSGRNMAGKIFPELTVINDVNDSDALLEYLYSFEKTTTKYLFLTHEKFHDVLWEKREELKGYNVIYYIGNKNPELILDKTKFLQNLKENTQVPVPISFSVDDIEQIQFPIFLKPKSSFIGDQRNPIKKADVKDKSGLIKYIQHVKKLEISTDEIEIQELLSTATKDNISVSGWYEKGFHQFYQTQKILQHPPKRGNGDVVKLMELNPILEKRTLKVLQLLDYHGPFEAEFVKEAKGSQYKLIEINPRFWMQHGLIEQISGHLLVARYCGIPATKPNKNFSYWMYTAIVPIQIAKLRLKYIPFIFRKDVYKPISFNQAGKFLVKYLKEVIKNEHINLFR